MPPRSPKVKPTATGPWMPQQPGPRQVGRRTWFYVAMAIGMAVIFISLVALDVILIHPAFDDDANSLHASDGLGAYVEIAFVGLVVAWIGVLWPIGILSQVVLNAALAAASRHAPAGSTLAAVTSLDILAPTVEPVVPTRTTLRWTFIGNIGWLPNLQLIAGASLVGIALAILSDVPDLRFALADMGVVFTIAAACGALGIAGLAWGSARRTVEMRRALREFDDDAAGR